MKNYELDYEEYQDDVESPSIILDIDQTTYSKVKPLNQHPANDKLINSEVILKSNSTLEKGKGCRCIYDSRRGYCWVMQ